jgi:hypothetical protein
VSRRSSPRLTCPDCGRTVTRSREDSDGTWRLRRHVTAYGAPQCPASGRRYDAETGAPVPEATPAPVARREPLDAALAALVARWDGKAALSPGVTVLLGEVRDLLDTYTGEEAA